MVAEVRASNASRMLATWLPPSVCVIVPQTYGSRHTYSASCCREGIRRSPTCGLEAASVSHFLSVSKQGRWHPTAADLLQLDWINTQLCQRAWKEYRCVCQSAWLRTHTLCQSSPLRLARVPGHICCAPAILWLKEVLLAKPWSLNTKTLLQDTRK